MNGPKQICSTCGKAEGALGEGFRTLMLAFVALRLEYIQPGRRVVTYHLFTAAAGVDAAIVNRTPYVGIKSGTRRG